MLLRSQKIHSPEIASPERKSEKPDLKPNAIKLGLNDLKKPLSKIDGTMRRSENIA